MQLLPIRLSWFWKLLYNGNDPGGNDEVVMYWYEVRRTAGQQPTFVPHQILAGKGTGLGLSTVYGIVKQSGGFIFADNVEAPDGAIIGARFTVYLPVHEVLEDEKAKAPEVETTHDWSGGGRILLVEDDAVAASYLRQGLSESGHAVEHAADGQKGLSLARSGDYDVLIIDRMLPGQDGTSIVTALRQARSPLTRSPTSPSDGNRHITPVHPVRSNDSTKRARCSPVSASTTSSTKAPSTNSTCWLVTVPTRPDWGSVPTPMV